MIILGIGSNLGNREQNIASTIQLLAKHGDIFINKVSSLYETEPVGVKEQPAFLNLVIEISTNLPPLELLRVCLQVEKQLGRVRDKRWGPRTIDIDVLIYDDVKLDSEELILPHPRLHERNFVLIPLQEIAGDMPIYNGRTIKEMLLTAGDASEVVWYRKLNWEE